MSVEYLTLLKDNEAYRRDKISEIVTWVVLRDGHVGREANRDNIVCTCVRAFVFVD